MRKTIFQCLIAVIFFNTIAITAKAQHKIISNSTKQALSHTKAVNLNLFEPSEQRDAAIDAGIKNVIYLKLNKNALQEIADKKPATIAFQLPIESQELTILMNQYNIFDSKFEAKTKGASAVYEAAPQPDGVFYRGYASGDDYSLAALSFFQNEAGGIISISGAKGNYNLALNKQNPGIDFENYILYKESDVVDGAIYAPKCQIGAAQENINSAKNVRLGADNELGLSCKTVSIALYGDYLLYQKNLNSLSGTQNYLTIVFNGVAALYQNDGIRVALKQLNVNTVNDFYPTATSTNVLVTFGNEIATNTTADLMQFVTGHSIVTSGGIEYAPLGGLAWLNVLCTTPFYYQDYDTYVGPFSMINTMGAPNIPSVPVYSWDISCATHEFGHSLGSPHTHSCSWNGNNTQIDNCAGTYNAQYADTNCAPASIPSSGTIMSYCHLLSGVGINFINGFGPQPAALIRSKIESATCLSSDYLPNLVLNQSNTTINANGFCMNNNELYCYDTKNDFNRANDELILILQNNNIGNLNLSNVQITMNTAPDYANNIAIDATSYAYVDPSMFTSWFTSNRSWTINLNQILGGTTKISFPFLNQDKSDLTGSNPSMNLSNDSMYMLVYKTANAVQNPASATAADVSIFEFGTGANSWSSTSNANYHTATISNSGEVFGATLATGQSLKDLSIKTFVNSTLIKLFPNPTNGTLHVQYDGLRNDLNRIEIIDYLGRTKMAVTPESIEQKIDVASLSSGLYMIKCVTSKGIFINKFVKQ